MHEAQSFCCRIIRANFLNSSMFVSFNFIPGYGTSIPHNKDRIWIRRSVISGPTHWFRIRSKIKMKFFGTLEVIISVRYLICSRSLFLTTMYFSGTWPPSLPSTRPLVGSSLCIFTLSWCRTFKKRNALLYFYTIPKYAVAKYGYKEFKNSMPQNCAYHPNFLKKWKLKLGPGPEFLAGEGRVEIGAWPCILAGEVTVEIGAWPCILAGEVTVEIGAWPCILSWWGESRDWGLALHS